MGVRLLVAVCAALMVSAAPALADSTVRVNTTNSASPAGDGLCSLPEAVAYADGTPEPDCSSTLATGTTTIVLPASSTPYAITSTLDLTAPAIIDGGGASDTVISGGSAVQVLKIPFDSITVTVSGVTITDGLSGDNTSGCTTINHLLTCPAESGIYGGGISSIGTLTLNNDVISDNHASDGIGPTGLFSCIQGCQGAGSGNGGWGGGIYNDGRLTIDDSTITGNSAGAGGAGGDGITASGGGPGEKGGDAGSGGGGGGIYNDGEGRLTVTGSTISDNSAGSGGNAGQGSNATTSPDDGGNAGTAGGGADGGGIYSDGSLTVTDSTISGNQAGAGGAGARGGAGDGLSGAPGTNSGGGAGGWGGGIEDDPGATHQDTITNSTLAANIAAAGGAGGLGQPAGAAGSGGALDDMGGETGLSFDTIAYNVGGDQGSQLSMSGLSAQIFLGDSIVSVLPGGSNPSCAPLFASFGGNVDYGDPTHSCPGEHADPKLGPLTDNGGPTQTFALGAGSGAIGLVPSASCTVTTDQRGVVRPQNGDCDAGAYQTAPPAITSATAAATSSSGGSVSAKINPNLGALHTLVTVKYGTTPAYGSSTQPQDIGNGNAPVAFSATLNNLSPRTTYYAEVIATNADGTTTAAAGAFTTPGPAATSPPPTGPTKTATGSTKTPIITANLRVKWAPGKRSTAVRTLTLTGLPAGAAVKLTCRGGGCPFRSRLFTPRHGTVSLAKAFAHHRLRPKATLELVVTARGEVGQVIVFTVRSGRAPREQKSCLPPDASRPTACA